MPLGGELDCDAVIRCNASPPRAAGGGSEVVWVLSRSVHVCWVGVCAHPSAAQVYRESREGCAVHLERRERGRGIVSGAPVSPPAVLCAHACTFAVTLVELCESLLGARMM